MSDNILDYRFDRSRSAKEEVETLLTRRDSWSLLNCVTVEELTVDLNGKTYVRYTTVSLKSLAKRSYLIHWGHQFPAILYTDVAHLPQDVRTHNTDNRNLPIHRLTAMEQAMMKLNFKKYRDQNLKHWGKVDAVNAK